MKVDEQKIKAIVKARKIMLAAGKAYIRSQRARSFRDHTREEITSAWIRIDDIMVRELKKLKEGI